ncbi:unnamed protein product [Acanthoscelides obtectus]|uniref:Cytochrome P450 n=1 Tax=Acanthoscelides obtectus TaxID=200917 RepID=A0A9P0KES1_ACAOB|nr:unnamed protein product [Acanthoscelides obtectus]CAK1676478.1 Probable cytochrome P450 6d4 [Acanthoscelides obtectus]
MSTCSASQHGILERIANYIDEKTFFTALVSITFFVLFLFLYILHAYTFFGKIRIKDCATPTAPFGNLSDVIFHNDSWYMFLRKHYNRLRRKKLEYGGLYLFFKPSMLISDQALIERLILYQKENDEIFDNLISKDVIQNALEKMDPIFEECNQLLTREPYGHIFYKFFLNTSELLFGFIVDEKYLQNSIKEITSSSFKKYFSIAYSCFNNKNPYFYVKASIQRELESRKENDIKQNDILQNLSKVDSTAIENLSEIFIENIFYSTLSTILCLYELSQDDTIQEELVGEIRRLFAKEGKMQFEYLDRLPYMDAVVKESLRKWPPVPVEVIKNEQDIEGLPKNKNILYLLSIYGIQNHQDNFVDPEQYDPDRFLEDNVKETLFLPFGIGPHREIDRRLTTLNIKLAIISILSMYKVTIKSGYHLELDKTKMYIQPKNMPPLHFEFINH